MINKKNLILILSNIEIKTINFSINVRNIELIKYFTIEYYLINLYIFNIINEKITIIYIRRKIYIINNFKIKIFIKIDILNLKRIYIKVNEKRLFVKNCNNLIVDIKIEIKNYVDVYYTIQN